MMSEISYGETPEFQKDFKKLFKKFKSLKDDLELAKIAAIELFHIQKINNLSIFPIQKFWTEEIQVCKIKKFACRALKGKGCRSGIRVIYTYFPSQNKIEFIQIYYKERENTDCDYGRIKKYLKNIS